MAEWKKKDYSTVDTTFSTPATGSTSGQNYASYTFPMAVDQGTGKNQRIGNEIYVSKLLVKWKVEVVLNEDADYNSYSPKYLRIVAYKARNDDDAVRGFGEDLEIIDREKWVIFQDKKYFIEVPTRESGTKPFYKYGSTIIPINKKVIWNSSMSEWNRHIHFYMLLQGDSSIPGPDATTLNPIYTLKCSYRIRQYWKDL